MKTKVKSEKGIMAIYVTVTLVTFIIILLAIFSGAVAVRKNQIKTLMKIKEVYEKDNDKKEEISQEIKKEQKTTVSMIVSKDIYYIGEAIEATITYGDFNKVKGLECRYIFSNSKEKLGTDITKYTGGIISKNGTTISYTPSKDGTYYLHLLTTFRNGEREEMVSDLIQYDPKQTTENKVSQ